MIITIKSMRKSNLIISRITIQGPIKLGKYANTAADKKINDRKSVKDIRLSLHLSTYFMFTIHNRAFHSVRSIKKQKVSPRRLEENKSFTLEKVN